jgi:enterochelin esterase-like enzyme
MTRSRLGIAFLLAVAAVSPAPAQLRILNRRDDSLDRLNATLCGKVLDYTHNHGHDNRIYSAALCAQRDVYVYIPHGYDGKTKFPVMLALHGFGQDESKFLEVIEKIDAAIHRGDLPPMVIVAPDGTVKGYRTFMNTGAFYLNGASGRFEDYTIQDVWGWVRNSFSVRPEREAHVLLGASMGGFAAYNLGFKYPTEFSLLVGLLPALDIRYSDVFGNNFAAYDPNTFAYREHVAPLKPVGRVSPGIVIRERAILNPIFGRDRSNAIPFMSANNPVEMLDTYDIKPGMYEMFIGYGTKDDLNVNAQCEHFIDVAKKRGICPTVVVVPCGRHRSSTADAMFPDFCRWLQPRLAPYAPGGGK